MASTSAWSWRNLLSPGSSGGAGGQGTAAGVNGRDDEASWAEAPDHPLDLPNMLGMENFGNTCYLNSILQALWFCDPFRESILAYMALRAEHSASSAHKVASSSAVPMSESNQVTLFSALQSLFNRMATLQNQSSKVSNPAKTPDSPPAQSTSSSFGSALSRKVSSRPGTGGPRGGAGNATASPAVVQTAVSSAAQGSGPTQAAGTSASTCSNVLVPDTEVKAFLQALKKSNILFDSTAHQDAHELLNHVLNAIGDDLVAEFRHRNEQAQSANGYTPLLDVSADGKTFVHRIFEGVLTNETKCMTCESVTSRDECFLDLSLDIERNMSVSGCLQQFSASEMLCSRNKFFCDTCSALQEAEKRMKIKKQPLMLALHLKRFKYEESMGRFVKLAYRVVFPMQLRLSNISDDADEPDKLYKLYGIIVHIGQGPHHGHYIAILRISTRWFLFDDETIRIIDEEDIVRYYGDASGPGSAYVLFYQAAEMDFEGLGIPNVKQFRADNARRRRQEAMAQKAAEALPLKRQPTRDACLDASSELSLPSRTDTPAEGKSSLFSRRAFNISTSASASNMAGTTGADALASPGESGKSSWLTSLKPRKASVSNATPAVTVPSVPTGIPEHGSGKGSTLTASPSKMPSMQSSPSKDFATGSDAASSMNSASHLSRQRSPTQSHHSGTSRGRSVSPHPGSEAGKAPMTAAAALDGANATAEAQVTATPPKPSAGLRMLSGLGIGSPPKRTSTLPLQDETPSLGGSSHILANSDAKASTGEKGIFGSRSRVGSVRRPLTADNLYNPDATQSPVPSHDSFQAPSNASGTRRRSPSAAVEMLSGQSTSANTANQGNTGSLGRRRTTLSRAFGLMRGNKDKDKT